MSKGKIVHSERVCNAIEWRNKEFVYVCMANVCLFTKYSF